ncbi:MAG: D-alanyl-D-alanine carboxypeptidase [Chlamydiia bacterium]|nr:D-alanyl-D-alanine carboxypeptidase [Chlamydiia bacterium]
MQRYTGGMLRIVVFFALISALYSKSLDVNVIARSAILMNAETGAVLFEKDSRSKAYPASTTKIATLLYILEQQKLPFDRLITVSADALKMKHLSKEVAPHLLIPDGTMMGLMKGEKVSVEALLHGLMLVSGNDAANVLAEAHAGSVPQFMEELNRYLRETVGCTRTQLCNPHGIHWHEHYTCAYDLCLIARKGLQVPKFRQIVSTMIYRCPKSNKRPEVELKQFNALLKKGRHHYPKAFGIKTGFHSNAMNALVAAAEHEGRVLIAVLLGCPNSGNRYQDAIRLFEAAFKEKQQKKHILGPERILTHPISKTKKTLRAALAKELELTFFPSEEPQCKAMVHWEALSFPIKKGQKVGEVHLIDEQQRVLKKGDLLAKEEIQGSWLQKLLSWL